MKTESLRGYPVPEFSWTFMFIPSRLWGAIARWAPASLAVLSLLGMLPTHAWAAQIAATTRPLVTGTTGSTKQAFRLDGWTGVATYPGGRPIVVTLNGQGLSKLTSVRVLGSRGEPTQTIDAKLGPGTDISRQMTLVVKAEALIGRYTLVGLGPEGSKNPFAFGGAFDFSVIDSKLGLSPISAMMAMIGACKPPGMPGPGSTTGPGGNDPSTLGTSVGLLGNPTGDPRGTPDFSSHTPGADPALGYTPGSKATFTSVSSSTDVMSSGGTQKITTTIITILSDGTKMTDTMTHTTFSDGRKLETQRVEQKNPDGTVVYSSSISTDDTKGNTQTSTSEGTRPATSQGTSTSQDTSTTQNTSATPGTKPRSPANKTTPVPDEGSCTTDQCRQAARQFAAMFPLLGAMEKRFVEARFGSLRGDTTEPGTSRTLQAKPTQPLTTRAIDDARVQPLIHTTGEAGSSGSSTSSVIKVKPTTKPTIGQPKPVDPPRPDTGAGSRPPGSSPVPKP